jgi:Sulfotransferase family
MPELRKKRIMQFYAGCVLRHNYVYNRDGSKRFLSKNPAMMAKVESLHQLYPDATLLNINRCPASTIPSTIALNNNIYRFFTSRKSSKEMDNKTKDILVEWYKMAEMNLESYFLLSTIKICFTKLILGDETTRKKICDHLGLKKNIFMQEDNSELKKIDHKSSNTYVKLNEIELAAVVKKIPFMSAYCTADNI